MEKLGTNYGGWFIPTDIELDKDSVVYSGGVGEDISFDILLNSKYDCNIILIDPTKKAIKHYEEIQNYYNNNNNNNNNNNIESLKVFTGNIQNDYYKYIEGQTPNFNKFLYINKGLWNCKDELKFYKQSNENYVSQSLIENMFSSNYEVVEVDTIKNIMEQNNHHKIDLLKLDIEGAEINVIEKMLDDKIYPKYLLIEFDLLLKNKDPQSLTLKLINRLMTIENYKILVNDNLNITFQR